MVRGLKGRIALVEGENGRLRDRVLEMERVGREKSLVWKKMREVGGE